MRSRASIFEQKRPKSDLKSASVTGFPGHRSAPCSATSAHCVPRRLGRSGSPRGRFAVRRRTMQRDGGWTNLLLEEAENEKMHLLAFIKPYEPGLLFRCAVIGGQVVLATYFGLMRAAASPPRGGGRSAQPGEVHWPGADRCDAARPGPARGARHARRLRAMVGVARPDGRRPGRLPLREARVSLDRSRVWRRVKLHPSLA